MTARVVTHAPEEAPWPPDVPHPRSTSADPPNEREASTTRADADLRRILLELAVSYCASLGAARAAHPLDLARQFERYVLGETDRACDVATSRRVVGADDDIGETPARRIIERFGGTRRAAAVLAKPVTTVQGWKKSGFIPSWCQDDVLRAGKDLDPPLQPADFFDPLPPACNEGAASA